MPEKVELLPDLSQVSNNIQQSNKALQFRPAQLMDIVPLATLIEDHRSALLDDYTHYSRPYLRDLLQTGLINVIAHDGYAAGAFWFTHCYEDLHAQLHFLLNPKYFRQALQENVIPAVLNEGFTKLCVRKLKAQAYQTQSSAMSLLKKFGFQQVGMLQNETRIGGKEMNLYLFELSYQNWREQESQNL